jgi:hypothetical protein
MGGCLVRKPKSRKGGQVSSFKKLAPIERLAIVAALISCIGTVVAAMVTVTGPFILQRSFSTKTPQFASPAASQPTLTLGQYASSLTSSCDQAPSEYVATVDKLSESLAPPIRFDFVAVHPAANLLPDGFNPVSETLPKNIIVNNLPAVDVLEFYLDIVGLNEKEWIRMENFLLVSFESIEQLPQGDKNIALSVYGGGSRTYHSAACWTGSAQTGKSFVTPRVDFVDLFTIQPGEIVPFWLTLDLSKLEPAIYTFSIGVVYTYQGETHVAWSEKAFSLVVPDGAHRTDWIETNSGGTFVPATR